MHYQLSDTEHAMVSEAKRDGAHFDRPEMLCRTGDGHAKGTRHWRSVTCPGCVERIPFLYNKLLQAEIKSGQLRMTRLPPWTL
jgi:hypothetical protein